MDLFTSGNTPYYSLYKQVQVEGLANPPPTNNLLDPSNIFLLENNLINQLETYNKQYARFVRCNNPDASGSVTGPSCDVINLDTSANLLNQYNTVTAAIVDLSNALIQTSSISGVAPPLADASFASIQTQHTQLVTTRTKMDEQIKSLFDKNGNFNPTAESLDYTAVKYTNMCLTILCVAMVYAIIRQIVAPR